MRNNRHTYYILGGLLLVVLLSMVVQGVRHYTAGQVAGQLVGPVDGATETASAPEIVVHVTGAVNKPGVYRLVTGSRVEDALVRAEITAEADGEALNRAAVLVDGQKLVVPVIRREGSDSPDWTMPTITGASPPRYQGSKPVAGMVVGSSTPGGQSGLVNINTADVAELDTLPGIGPALAQRIIDYRATKPFQRIEDIQQVSGIGEKKFAALKEEICVVN
ncbi:MAG: ComEA family DNA-binding protein [Heliobacteriaceae bacterium]|nr:ComEA family DNA-binding protein [Heliobacteriaceae bacterium]MDD4586880.1 ComEA family DNA-binding protein [Heliobacteriaceae bacterium]